jgi:catechol 2,3-dioxygenase-like lactoylglutathione lyase family enzyme
MVRQDRTPTQAGLIVSCYGRDNDSFQAADRVADSWRWDGDGEVAMIDRIDHVVMNCRDVEAMASWYERALGLRRESFGPDGRLALKFGRQKINLRPTGAANWQTGAVDAPGSLDVCFITEQGIDPAAARLRAAGIAITQGPMTRTGAMGPMTSIYCRDPDGNLVEIASYAPADAPTGR